MASSHPSKTVVTTDSRAATTHQATDEMVAPTLTGTPRTETNEMVRHHPNVTQHPTDETRTNPLPFTTLTDHDETSIVKEGKSGNLCGHSDNQKSFSSTNPERTSSTLDVASSMYRGRDLCALCRKKEANIDSHLIPCSVLFRLCKLKDGSLSNIDIDAKKQKRYLFRTDIEPGRAVTVAECATGCKKFLCGPCEKRFQYLDICACKYWSADNWEPRIVNNGKDMTEIVLFSFMVRAARVSLRLEWKTHHKSLEDVKCTFLEDTDEDFKETVKKLSDFGFVYCCLNRDKKYRIEFPVFCTFQLKECKMKAICMQVPPFFFLLPVLEESETVENCSQVKLLLMKNLPDIAYAVQTKLQELLDQFVEQQQKNRDSKDKRKSGLANCFHLWYLWYRSSNYHQTQSSPLLIFDYIDEGLNQLDIKLNIY